jgi:hypothetical protein
MRRLRAIQAVWGTAMLCVGCGGSGGTLTGSGGNTGTGGAGLRSGGITGGGNVPGMNCGGLVSPASPLPPLMLIVLDASSSMNDDMNNMSCAGGCGQQSKWAAAVAAINSVAGETTQDLLWGVELFGMDRANVCGTFDSYLWRADVVASGLSKHTSANGGVLGGTNRPTALAVRTADSHVFGVSEANPKYLLLMTDGVPGCAAADASAADDNTADTVLAIGQATSAGAPTFVVGIATAGGPAHASMLLMGDAGARVPATSSGAYFNASSADDIRAALRSVVDMTAGCTFAVPLPPVSDGSLYREAIGVAISGREIPRDLEHTAGWDYANASHNSVQLFGQACELVKGNPSPPVTIIWRCLLGV